MISFILGFLSVLLLLVCGFCVLIVLMQRPSSNAGMGAALGGGAAEFAFGGETTSVLVRFTTYGVVCFFVIAFILYLGYMAKGNQTQLFGLELPAEVEVQMEKAEFDLNSGDLTQLPQEQETVETKSP